MPAAALLLPLLPLLLPPVGDAAAGASPAPTIAVDAASLGPRFWGVGGLSAGGSSRLLYDYPEPARSDVLDSLFAPGKGFGFQILKIEVGGDCQSSWGTEPSHMHSRADLNMDRGYELWLAAEARRRNPDIVLTSLAWCEPGWVRPGVLSPAGVEYHIKWLAGARQKGLEMEFVGLWNEQ